MRPRIPKKVTSKQKKQKVTFIFSCGRKTSHSIISMATHYSNLVPCDVSPPLHFCLRAQYNLYNHHSQKLCHKPKTAILQKREGISWSSPVFIVDVVTKARCVCNGQLQPDTVLFDNCKDSLNANLAITNILTFRVFSRKHAYMYIIILTTKIKGRQSHNPSEGVLCEDIATTPFALQSWLHPFMDVFCSLFGLQP